MGQYVTDMGCEKKQPKKELKKHSATIHCSNSLSLLQRKISNALLYHAYKELMLKEEHEITVKQLCRLIGYQGNNHAAIREALRGLISTVIEWNVINDETGSENWTASSIIASVSLEGPLCYYAYSPRMKQLLHSPSMFGKIDLVIQSRFRSSYGLALYENCTRYRGLPQTKWFDMELFKKLMGVPQGKYDIFRDFKRRVLDKAVDEVNTYSDLIIAAEYIREGRQVAKVRFKLKERAKKTRLGHSVMQAVDVKTKLVQQFALSTEQIEQLFSAYSETFIADKIKVIETSKAYKSGKIENLAGYLLSAVKHNYQAPKVIAPLIPIHDPKQDLELAEAKKQVEEVRGEYQLYREKMIAEAIQGLKKADRATFLENFLHQNEKSIKTILRLQRSKYTRDTILESPQMQALLRQFALRELDLLSLISLEEFVVQQDEEKIGAWQKLKSYDPDHPLLRFSE